MPKLRPGVALVPLAFVSAVVAARPWIPAPPEGNWDGVYETSESGGELSIRVQRSGDGWNVAVRATSSYVADPQFLAAGDPRVAGDTLQFTLNWGSPVRWTGVAVGDTMSGQMVADHWSGSWRVVRR